MRWYDIEPDVYMAISLIEIANDEQKIDYANFIIKTIKVKDTELNFIKNKTKNNIKNKYQRWYDKNDTLSTAIEYLKNTTPKLQKEISLDVLNYKKEQEALTA